MDAIDLAASENLVHKNTVNADNKTVKVARKRDFFGRVIVNEESITGTTKQSSKKAMATNDEGRVWVTFHEGFSNAVRKPITLKELMDGM